MEPLVCDDCQEKVFDLSPRNKCASCEYKRAKFYEKEHGAVQDAYSELATIVKNLSED